MKDLRQKTILRGLRVMHRWRRALTLGARVAVFDENNRVLLVRHTYQDGWIFPGGGVEFGETARDAAIREIKEEAGIIAASEPELFGIYSNHASFPGDHLVFYVVRDFHREPWRPDSEIAAAEFFDAARLPVDVNVGSRRRLDEIAGHAAKSALW